MGFSAGPAKNLGFRLHKTNDGGATPPCTTGSTRLVATTGGSGAESCVDFTTTNNFHRLRVAVDAAANTFKVFDLDTGAVLNEASGSDGNSAQSNLSWGVEIDDKGGFHIGSFSGGNTTNTDFELDYFRVLLGVAVNSPTTPILPMVAMTRLLMRTTTMTSTWLFRAFQACYTGQTDLVTQLSCRCFDRNGDNHVEEQDFNAFRNCANLAGLLADLNCDGL